jgi:hypothetical protein
VKVAARILSLGSAALWLFSLGACAGLGHPEDSTSDTELPAVGLGYGPGPDASAGAADEAAEHLLDVLGPAQPRVYYQYVDEDAVVHFTESLLEVPEEWRERAGRVESDVPLPHTPPEARMLRKLRLQRDLEAQDF